MTRSQTRTRRRYLAAAGTGTLAAIVGCTGFGDDGPGGSNDSVENSTLENDTPGDTATEGNVDDVNYEEPAGSISFAQPTDGDTVTNPVRIEIDVENFEVEPARENPNNEAGHMHVIVDKGCVEPTQPIPQEDGYHHLGEGQTETELELEPGEHDLCLQAGDGLHVAYDLTDEITITVEAGSDGGDSETVSESGGGSGNGSESGANESGNGSESGNETNESE